jgi:hypothetical protein
MPVSTLLMSSLASSGGGGGGRGAGLANIAGGLVGGITGFFQRRKAKKELAKLKRPEYEIPQEILRSQKMAEQAANEGLPSQQYNQAQQNIQRQQSRAISAASDRRGGLMALPGVQQQANDSLLNLDVKDAQARMNNQQRVYGINSQLAGYKDKAWEINKMQPYERDYNYYQSLLGAGNQNMLAGADKFLGGSGQLAFGGGNSYGGGNSSSGRKMTAGKTNAPTYYNGYDSGSDYSTFQNGF